MSTYHWWLVYGPFRPGLDGLPHFGDVIKYYRESRGWSREELAQRYECTVRYVYMLESDKNMDEPRLPSRRKALAGLLLVPPALLDLTGKSPEGERKVIEYLSQPNLELLQSIVSLAWSMFFSGDFQATTGSIDAWLKHAAKAQKIAKGVTRDQLNATIIHMLQLSATSARDRGDLERAEAVGAKALTLSEEIRNVEMVLASQHHLFRAYMQGDNWNTAKHLIDESFSLVNRHTSVSPALRGTIYADVAEVYAMLARRGARGLTGQALNYYDKAASVARASKGDVESEFIRFSLASVMTERANAEAWFHQQREGLNSLALAKKTMPVSNIRWTRDYLLSSASLHFNEEDITACYLDMLESLKIHKELSSTTNLNWMLRLHARCIQIEPDNKYRPLIETGLQDLQN